LALKEEYRLRVFENILEIFGSRGDKVTGRKRKLHKEELQV
jgi:hypothetical protein